MNIQRNQEGWNQETQFLTNKQVEHWSVFILLTRKNGVNKEILLVLNKKEVKAGNRIKGAKWGLPGGEIERSEIDRGAIATVTALKREMKEETGLDIEMADIEVNFKNRNLPYIGEKPSWYSNKAVARVIVFYGEWNDSVDLRPLPGADVTVARWFPIDQLPDKNNIYESHRIRIDSILQALSQ